MIPDFQTLMLPLLKVISNGEEFSTKEVNSILANQFNLNDEQLQQLLPSGKQTIFTNRVAWAKAYLKMANLLESTKRGSFKITKSGINVLNQNPEIINLKFLKNIPEYVEAVDYSKNDNGEKSVKYEPTETETPEEIIEESFLKINKTLSQELLTKLKTVSPYFFENLVVELLVKMGYGGSLKDAGKAIGRSGDEGIDGIIKEDKLGLDIIYIQAKRWEGNVGRPEIQKFVGALAGQGAKKGVFITTSKFTPDALNYIPRNETKIVLIDGQKLAQLMIENNLGVATHFIYELKKFDSDYFDNEYL
ncbi:restriction endonuclease [Chryseobacterium lacus]|uniref:restriction endonuclease n=1 Tax=Chryseobacterium lacus TaxID=2058346 RepID=UPI000F87FF67|nr:restriction endonuclease [Chryseobacterium lacus]RST28146.1 restriction endonuclease [Chryseobacterium lacus]